MSKTKHMEKRMSERGVSHLAIDLVENFGFKSHQGDKLILNRNDLILMEQSIFT